MAKIEDILSRLSGVKPNGSNHRANCPCGVHDKVNNFNLSIFENDNGSVGLHCHALCTAQEVLSEIGLKLKDLFPDQSPVEREQWIEKQAVVNSEAKKDKLAIKFWVELSVIKQAVQGRIFGGDEHPACKADLWPEEKRAVRMLGKYFREYYK